MSGKASGTPHPAVLSMETPPAGATAPGGRQGRRTRLDAHRESGDLTFSVIVVGKAEG